MLISFRILLYFNKYTAKMQVNGRISRIWNVNFFVVKQEYLYTY